MSPCQSYGKGTIHVCRSTLTEKFIGLTRKKWCFKCRAYNVHKKILLIDEPVFKDGKIVSGGLYEPVLTLRCPTCHQDNTSFPGC